MSVDDGVAFVFNEVRFEQDPLSHHVQAEALDPIKNHACQVSVVARSLENRNVRLVRLAVTSLFPSRFSFRTTHKRGSACHRSRLQKAAPAHLLDSSEC